MKADLRFFKTVKTVFSLDSFAEELKFGKQGPFCRAYVLTSKPDDELVVWRFAQISHKISKIMSHTGFEIDISKQGIL